MKNGMMEQWSSEKKKSKHSIWFEPITPKLHYSTIPAFEA
jgi:hypothetical protein